MMSLPFSFADVMTSARMAAGHLSMESKKRKSGGCEIVEEYCGGMSATQRQNTKDKREVFVFWGAVKSMTRGLTHQFRILSLALLAIRRGRIKRGCGGLGTCRSTRDIFERQLARRCDEHFPGACHVSGSIDNVQLFRKECEKRELSPNLSCGLCCCVP